MSLVTYDLTEIHAPGLLRFIINQYMFTDCIQALAAHVCYVLAGLHSQPYDATSQVCLVGADHRAYPRCFATPPAMQRNEILEWARGQGTPCCRHKVKSNALFLISNTNSAGLKSRLGVVELQYYEEVNLSKKAVPCCSGAPAQSAIVGSDAALAACLQWLLCVW